MVEEFIIIYYNLLLYMNNNKPSNKISGGVQPNKSPFQMYLTKPINIMVFLSFLSPAILSIIIISLSFIFQNFKGLIFFLFLLGSAILREVIFRLSGMFERYQYDNSICTAVTFTTVGYNTFSVFVASFILMYLCLPMFLNDNINWWLFTGLVFYISLDVGIKSLQGCIIMNKNGVQMFLDLLVGLGLASIWVAAMSAGGSSKYLYFNEATSDSQVCSMPKKQQFKCSVYKNGELISNI